jgi:hypothetical protein
MPFTGKSLPMIIHGPFTPVFGNWGMRRTIIGVGLTVALSCGLPETASALGASGLCLSSGETLEAVSNREVVAPARAIVIAKRVVPGADVLRAALCREGDELVYRIMMLQKDGRLVRVFIKAPSGDLMNTR